jgi:hypothetical protein
LPEIKEIELKAKWIQMSEIMILMKLFQVLHFIQESWPGLLSREIGPVD